MTTHDDATAAQRTRLPNTVDLVAMEHELLDWWERERIFERSLAAREGAERWTFYEGPPTANGLPGTHHIEARAFKDVFPRFQTMRGRYVPRIAGWDCHGLPVEIAVEKELGISGKPDIEQFGIAEFNARCRESVTRHVNEFNVMTRRMGYWVDLDEAYWTMDRDYIQSVWWSLAQIHSKGLLVRDFRVAPYCGRCGTGLSDHEVAQGYEDIVDPSIYVRFPLVEGDGVPDADLLVWTTTPWTLVSNTAVGVAEEATYVAATPADGGRAVIVAEELVERAVGDDATTSGRWKGTELVGWAYRRPLDLVEIPDAHRVIAAEHVTTSDGTGLVHLAPAFGAEDLAAIRSAAMEVVNPIQLDGHFEPAIPLVGGLWFRDANPPIIEDLRSRGILLRELPYEHAYPHCWRCHMPLLNYALPSWYIRTTEISHRLLEENERTNWVPETVKWGRYGDWLRGNVDWSLSRSRYWGTPLPIWICPDDHETAVESLAHLSELSGTDCAGLDPHRPFVDEVTFGCPTCGQPARRVSEVIDVWYDSGAMPFAQFGHPFRNADVFEAAYPAQYICEAIDQTRGWFYSLMAVGTLVFDRSSYENVVVLGHILAEDGRKMSKHLGNVIAPMPLLDEHGADAVRWFMLCSGSPWNARRVGHTNIGEVVRKVVLGLWNTSAFFTLYASVSDWDPAASDPGTPNALDAWAHSRLARLVVEVTEELESFDTAGAGKHIAAFLDDLSNWYVRRSRRRFWQGDPAALATLREVLHTLVRLMAPFTPFVTERIWSAIRSGNDPVSVHLAEWPSAEEARIDTRLEDQVELTRRLVELGRSARASQKIKTRQPLSRALVGAHGWAELPDDLRRSVIDELNVQAVETLGSAETLTDVSAKPNFRSLGAKHGAAVQEIAAAIRDADPTALAAAVAAGSASVSIDGTAVDLDAEDVVITETPREGWAVASEGAETIAVDLQLTPLLVSLGAAREVVRLVQEGRKTSGFDVADRIHLRWAAEGGLASAIEEHRSAIAEEVLATSFEHGDDPEGRSPVIDTGDLRVWLEVDHRATP